MKLLSKEPESTSFPTVGGFSTLTLSKSSLLLILCKLCWFVFMTFHYFWTAALFSPLLTPSSTFQEAMDCERRSYLGLLLLSWKEEFQGKGPYFPLKRRGDKCSFFLSRNEAPWRGVHPHWGLLPLVWVVILSPAPTARRGLGVGSCGRQSGVGEGWSSVGLSWLLHFRGEHTEMFPTIPTWGTPPQNWKVYCSLFYSHLL